jgi:hypothetical protein
MTDALGDAGASSSIPRTEMPSTRSSKSTHAVDLGHDRTGVGVPLGQTLAAFDFLALVTSSREP